MVRSFLADYLAGEAATVELVEFVNKTVPNLKECMIALVVLYRALVSADERAKPVETDGHVNLIYAFANNNPGAPQWPRAIEIAQRMKVFTMCARLYVAGEEEMREFFRHYEESRQTQLQSQSQPSSSPPLKEQQKQPLVVGMAADVGAPAVDQSTLHAQPPASKTPAPLLLLAWIAKATPKSYTAATLRAHPRVKCVSTGAPTVNSPVILFLSSKSPVAEKSKATTNKRRHGDDEDYNDKENLPLSQPASSVAGASKKRYTIVNSDDADERSETEHDEVDSSDDEDNNGGHDDGGEDDRMKENATAEHESVYAPMIENLSGLVSALDVVKGHMKQHAKYHKTAQKSRLDFTGEPGRYICSTCGHLSKTKEGHLRHRRLRHRDKPFDCPYNCTYHDNTPDKLITHLSRRHNEPGLIVCPVKNCRDRRFVRRRHTCGSRQVFEYHVLKAHADKHISVSEELARQRTSRTLDSEWHAKVIADPSIEMTYKVRESNVWSRRLRRHGRPSLQQKEIINND